MPKLVLFFLLLFSSAAAVADPGVGMVMDKNGNLFYSDLTQVWMIQPDGTKSIAVPNVHTHELYLDKDGTLFGEHVWYNGEKQNTWGYYLWSRLSTGKIVKIKDSTAGFPEWVSFTRDDAGNMYYIEKGIPVYFWKIDTAKKKTLLGTKSFASVGRLYLSKKNDLYVSNGADLYWIPAGDSIELFLKDAGDVTGEVSSHTIMNTWGDNKGNIYFATGKVIKKTEKNRYTITIYKSAGDWSPSSGLIAPNGDFWVMEYNSKNEVRVNKISAAERKQIVKSNAIKLYVIPLLVTIGILLALYFLFRKKSK